MAETILIVEDSDDDFIATTRAFRKADWPNPVQRCSNGDQALDYLYQRGEYTADNAPRPGMILLDLNLPGTDGREVLSKIKSDPAQKMIPVVVLTTSGADEDVNRCYDSGANSYVKKPVDMDGYIEAIDSLKKFWLEVVALPGVIYVGNHPHR